MQYLFDNTIVSGGTAALVANVVLISFIVVAFKEKIPEDDPKKTQ